MSLPFPAGNRSRRNSGLDDSSRRSRICASCSRQCLPSTISAARSTARMRRPPSGAARGGLDASSRPTRAKLIPGPPKSAAPGAAQGFAKKMGVAVEELRKHPDTQRRILQLQQASPGRATHRRPGRSAAGHDPEDLFSEDDVLDRQGRAAFHPADPLDRGAAGRPGGSVRDSPACKSGNVTSGHRRLGAARDSGHDRQLRRAAARQRRDSVGGAAARR